MKEKLSALNIRFGQFLAQIGIGLRGKLIITFLFIKLVPVLLLTIFAWHQMTALGILLREIAVEDSSIALNASAVENIERMSTDTAKDVAAFLYARDDDILYLAGLSPSHDAYRQFGETKRGRLIDTGTWALAADGQSWERIDAVPVELAVGGASTNAENNDMDGFHYRNPDHFDYTSAPLYDEIVFIGLDGMEQIKYVAPDSTKKNYPMSAQLRNVSDRTNTYVKAEDYFAKLQALEPGEIYVSDVIGAYVGSNFIGMYTPDVVATASEERGYNIDYIPEDQAFAGAENPNGQRFEGIVRWATPVTDDSGAIIGYVSFSLNHDHIMEFVDHLTPMNERYTEMPSANEGNYAFIWDYQCRNISHPRHHSIVGYDPETGEPQIPWLETSIYEGWQASGLEHWTDYVVDIPIFDKQSREKKPAVALTQAGLVGLDGRYLNNAPQCTGWMDLTGEGGSGSFYILWSGIYKLNTAAAIPYYTGQYAPNEENGYSKRGFGFVAIGAGLEDFTRPATETEIKLTNAIEEDLRNTSRQLIAAVAILITVVVLIVVFIAFSLTGRIKALISGISRFRAGERQFRFYAPVKDEFGTLADSFDEMADSLVASVKNPLCITDMDHKVIYMNRQGLEFCHMTLDEMVGSNYGDSSIYPGYSRYDPILALNEEREADILFDESSGHYLKGMANFFTSKDGKKIGYIIETHDLTKMVLEQKQLEQQRSLLDKIFTSSPDLIWYTDTQGVFVTVNPRFASIAGQAPEELVGKTADQIFSSDLAQQFADRHYAAMDSSTPLYREAYITFADGHQEILDSVTTPIRDANGTLVGMLGFERNVTTRVEMEQALRDTQIELEKAVGDANRANEHKGEFLARMSHEIRTPMNAIIGLTNIVQRKLATFTGDSEERREIEGQVDRIEASSQHLLGLLNDILDLSKIDAGKIELTNEVMELSQLIDTVCSIIKPRCEEKNIQFVTDMDQIVPSTFIADPLRLRQVLINLLGNAVKFTPECGVVQFAIKKLDNKDGKTQIAFSVQDNGIGIQADRLDSIFEAFEQGGSNIVNQHGGTGLGLAISQRIVQLLGGKITVDSTVGKGSCFHFVVWLEETAQQQPQKVDAASATGKFRGKRLLLVDDVEINRLIVVSMLEETGIEIDEAANGLEALHLVSSTVKNPYDIILMDVQMPEMNGYEASEKIRAMGRADTNNVPIIALTANAFKEDIDAALSYGMNAHVAKPVDPEQLMTILLRFLGN